MGEQSFSEALDRVSSWATKIGLQNNKDISAKLFPLAIQMIHKNPGRRPTIDTIQLYLADTNGQFFCDLCWKQKSPHKDIVGAKNPIVSVSQAVDELLRRNETVTFLVYWDLKQYVQEELESDLESKDFTSVLDNVLTISGTVEERTLRA